MYIEPIDDPFFIGELLDGGKFVRREYKRAKSEDMPTFTLVEKKRYKNTPYYNLQLSLRDICFSVNAKIGQLGDYPYILIDKTKLIPRSYSFEPCTFFE